MTTEEQKTTTNRLYDLLGWKVTLSVSVGSFHCNLSGTLGRPFLFDDRNPHFEVRGSDGQKALFSPADVLTIQVPTYLDHGENPLIRIGKE